jgi:hypothetical protein
MQELDLHINGLTAHAPFAKLLESVTCACAF